MTRKAINEICVPTGQYCYVLNQKLGRVEVFVGPHATETVGEPAPVVWDEAKGKVVGTMLQMAMRPIVVVPRGCYAVVHNPCYDEGKLVWPKAGHTQVEPELAMGTRAIIEGPVSLVPWPGQSIDVQQIHELRDDQYVVTRSISTGERTVTRGPCRFLPTSDLEVLGQNGAVAQFGKHPVVQDAVRLLPTEWCVTRGPLGQRRYHYGYEEPVVFPEANETFESLPSPITGKPALTHPAIDLTQYGVAVEKLWAPKDGEAAYVETAFYWAGPGSEAAADTLENVHLHYWPNAHAQITKVVVPETIPVGERRFVVSPWGSVLETIDGPQTVCLDPQRGRLIRHPKVASGVWQITDNTAALIRTNGLVTPPSDAGNVVHTERVVEGPARVRLGLYDEIAQTQPTTETITFTRSNMTADMVEVSFEFEAQVRYGSKLWFQNPRAELIKVATQAVDEYLAETPLIKQMQDVHCYDGIKTAIYKALDQNIDPDEFGALGQDFWFNGLEVTRFAILNEDIYETFRTYNRTQVKTQLDTRKLEAEVAHAIRQAELADARQGAAKKAQEVELAALDAKHELMLRNHESAALLEKAELEAQIKAKQLQNQHSDLVADQIRKDAEAEADAARIVQEVELTKLRAQADAQAQLLTAISPQLTAALDAQAKTAAFRDVIQHIGPAALARDIPVMEFASKMLSGSGMESLVLPMQAQRE